MTVDKDCGQFMLSLRDLDLGPQNLLSAAKSSLQLLTCAPLACISVHGCCTPWPDSSQEVGLRLYKLLCKECTARSRTHSPPKLAASLPSPTRLRSDLSVRAVHGLPKRRPSLLENIERGCSLISFFFYFQKISHQRVSAPTKGQKCILLYT